MSGSTVPQSIADVASPPTAKIIPFPVRTKPADLQGDDRLARALESLNSALTEQKAALAAWREALGALKTSTTGLGGSLQQYHSRLGTLNDQVAALHHQAVTMEAWADRVLEQ
jgi:hypothetical protein